MNKNKVNFGLDVALVALFTLTAISLFGEGGRNELASTASQPGNLLHCLSGVLMLAGSTVHLVLHWDWIGSGPSSYVGLRTSPSGCVLTGP
jgi:hypothetical protein